MRMAREGTRPVKGNRVALIFLFATSTNKKGLVLANRSADRAAKLIEVEFFHGAGEVALGVEIGVAHKFQRATRECSLVPDLVVTSTVGPALVPYSAE